MMPDATNAEGRGSVLGDDTAIADALRGALLGLADDARALEECLGGEQPPHVQRYVVAALGYLLQTVDLIVDSVEALGFADDALVLRLAARLAVGDGEGAAPVLARLANEAQLVDAVLGDDLPRLADYVRALREGTVRGRPLDVILDDADAAAVFRREVRAWADTYRAPGFDGDPRWVIKLRAFLRARLP